MVADAVAFEPVSTPEFPANREINREFLRRNRDLYGKNRERFLHDVFQVDCRRVLNRSTRLNWLINPSKGKNGLPRRLFKKRQGGSGEK
jgi:hypothetical protein